MPNFSSSDLDRAYIDRKVFSFLVGIDRFTEAQTKEKLNEVYRDMIDRKSVV